MRAKLIMILAGGLMLSTAASLRAQSSSSSSSSSSGSQSITAPVARQRLRHPYRWHPYTDVTLQLTGNFNHQVQNGTVMQNSINTGGILVGLRYHDTPHLAFEINVAHNKDTFEYAFLNTGNTSVQGLQSETNEINVNAVYEIPFMQTFHPFVLGGGSLLNFGPSNEPTLTVGNAKVQNRPAGVVGFGTDVRLSHAWALRMQVRFLGFRAPDFGLSQYTTKNWMIRTEPSIGFVYRF